MKKIEDIIPGHGTSRGVPSKCPYCEKLLDCATSLQKGDYSPSPLDYTICIRCTEIAVYDEDLSLRKPTVNELINLQTSDVWPMIERARLELRRGWRTT